MLTLPALMVMLASGAPPLPEVSHTRLADTIKIVGAAGGKWGRVIHPVELLRIEGRNDQEPFGNITSIASTPDGGVLVFDAQGDKGGTFTKYDRDGRFVRNIGRTGKGPGEFSSSLTGITDLAVGPDGTIYLRTGDRVNCYSATGAAIGTITHQALGGAWFPNDIRAGENRSFYARSFRVVRGANLYSLAKEPIQHFGCGANDPIDSVLPPQSVRDMPTGRFQPGPLWSVASGGRQIQARTDRLSFTLTERRSGRVLLASAPFRPVAFLPEEYAQLKAIESWRDGSPRGSTPAEIVPKTKQAIGSMLTDLEGRVWFSVSATSLPSDPQPRSYRRTGSVVDSAPPLTFAAPLKFAGFRLSGEFLGEAQLPAAATMATFHKEFVWAVLATSEGEQALVKLRLPSQ